MEMIQKLLNTEEVSYTSHLNEKSLKQRIEGLFEQKTARLAGKLTSDNEFSAHDNLVVIGWNMPYLRRKAAYLKGEIAEGEHGTTIQLKVTPNAILPVFGVVAVISGVIISLLTMFNNTSNNFFLLLGVAFLALGIIYYPLSTLFRNRLRNKFVKYLGLRKS